MNNISSHPVDELGYHFVDPQYLPKGKNEYHLRNQQLGNTRKYRSLSTSEIDALVHNRNTSDNWNNILVDVAFNPQLVRNCKFYGLIRIGKLESIYHEFHNLRMPVGLYNSTIISSDIGNNVCIDNVNYLSHYIIGNDVMIANVNELATTDTAKFGNGIVKAGEKETLRVWVEVCNENGGRKILPYDGMLPGDAYLWSKYRDDSVLQEKFMQFTEKKFDKLRGYYGRVGERTIIKNCSIIKDTWIGSDAYLKGANKLKNLTINSDPERRSQIGEGCELVNGIIGYGCRIFYGVKAVRFVMSSHSQLKYGARLINSFLGNNSTISCCEVLNSLIFPSHEQHHNNSFLCASLIMGQSNIAAGATIGSNHNSRSPDGEIITGRGFWPGLCVSLKHNSKFASFTILAKGDYPSELNIPIPFTLISNDVAHDRLVAMPGYWFFYNMYALARNSWKYVDRDQRTKKIQKLEYNYLAPDTINEMFSSIELMDKLTIDEKDTAVIKGWENSNRDVRIIKVNKSKALFTELIAFYGIMDLIHHFIHNKFSDFTQFKRSLSAKVSRSKWINAGGQLIREEEVIKFRQQVRNGKITSWDAVHQFYRKQGAAYQTDRLNHAYTSLLEIKHISPKQFTADLFRKLMDDALHTKTWMAKGIHDSRLKDYTNPFRKMVYDNDKEMTNVMGRFEENNFIQQQLKELDDLKKDIRSVSRKLK